MILVTGAFGFIGVYLIDELLRQGHRVLATGHRESSADYFASRAVPYLHLDVAKEADFDKLPCQGIKTVLNLAGLMPANVAYCAPHEYIRLNTIGTLNVLEYCRSRNIHNLITTTSYADVENAWAVSPPIPDDTRREFRLSGDHAMYVISKNAAADSVLHYNEVYNLRGCVFRLPPVYGYGPHLSIYLDGKLYKSGFQIFLEKASTGEPIEIWGDPTHVRDVIYVKDVVQAFLKAIKSERARGIYNVASGRGITLAEQAEAMIEVFSPPGRRSEIVLRPDKPNGLKPYVFDVQKAKRDFGFEPQYTFYDMLVDYKKEKESGRFKQLIDSRPKH